jgi:hypothetical protein
MSFTTVNYLITQVYASYLNLSRISYRKKLLDLFDSFEKLNSTLQGGGS